LYLNLAVSHQSQALALFCEILRDINKHNARAVFAFAEIVVVYAFGFPETPEAQDPRTYLKDLYQVFILARGIQQAICSHTDFTQFLWDCPFAPIPEMSELRGALPEDATATIRRLYEVNELCRARNQGHDLQGYSTIIGNLKEMLSWVYGGMTANTIAGRWVVRLPSRFMELLREEEPLALVTLTHYGVVFQHLKPRWCFDEWCVRVSKTAWEVLDNQWRPLVHWPMKEILGVNYLEKVDTL
jgi:hypothetical protein